MNFDEFIEQIIIYIKNKMAEEVDIAVHEVIKNNGYILTGLCIRPKNVMICPTIYLDYYYESYKTGESIEKIGNRIIECYIENTIEDIDVDFFVDYSKVSKKLLCKVINYDKNRELLKDIPYEKIYDLAIVVYCEVKEKTIGKATILIKNEHLYKWNVTRDEVISVAKDNTRQNMSIEVKSMAQVLQGIDEVPSDTLTALGNVPMYVVSSNDFLYGAVYMCFQENLNSLYDRLGEEYYIIPSSIHELIIIGASKCGGLYELGQMIQEVNSTQLHISEVLSDHAYLFSKEQQVLIF